MSREKLAPSFCLTAAGPGEGSTEWDVSRSRKSTINCMRKKTAGGIQENMGRHKNGRGSSLRDLFISHFAGIILELILAGSYTKVDGL
jgi:hypothetical protein